MWHECFLPQSQGEGGPFLILQDVMGWPFLILQDVMGWALGFFSPCLGEGQQKTVSTETDFAGPHPPPLYFMTSPLYIASLQSLLIRLGIQ